MITALQADLILFVYISNLPGANWSFRNTQM